jgi:hypothetical protein
MLGLVWVIEGRMARLDAVPMLAACWDEASMAAGHAPVDGDVIYVGDSQLKLGVLPRVVQERTGLSGYNLAVHRGMPASSYHLLRRALESGASPRAVVVDFFPGLLATSPRLNASLWIRLLGPGDSVKLLLDAPDPGLAAQMLTGWLMPSKGFRDELRDGVLSSLRGEPSPSRRMLQSYRENWRANGGAEIADGRRSIVEGGESPRQGTSASRWRCRPENEVYIRRLIDLAADHRITVYWLIAPLSPDVRATRQQNGQEAAYSALVRKIQKDYPDLIVIDGRELEFDRDLFVDAVHVNGRGARLLSTAVANVLARDATEAGRKARWVTLRLEFGQSELAGQGKRSRSR